MKRIAARIAIALLAFVLGIVTSSLWYYHRPPQSLPPPVNAGQPPVKLDPPSTNESGTTGMAVATPGHTPNFALVFGNGLRLATNEMQIRNEFLRYKLNIIYPQIEGSEAPPIRKLNKDIERLVTERYQWLLNPSLEDLRLYKHGLHPEAFNSYDLYFEVIMATDSFLSIYFENYGYGIGAAHSVQTSFVINYDLAANRQVELSDIFKPGSKYLKLLSKLCTEKLLNTADGGQLFKSELAPVPATFKSWNMTNEGIRFNFDACTVFACASGKQRALIPFAALRPMLAIR